MTEPITGLMLILVAFAVLLAYMMQVLRDDDDIWPQ